MLPCQSLEHRRANIKWTVRVTTEDGFMEGVTLTISSEGAFISCLHPFRVYDECEMVIDVPNAKAPVHAVGRVVWSNIYGPDDNISPRGMGVRFTRISGKDREAISSFVLNFLNLKDVQPAKSTIEVSPDPTGASTSLH